VTMGHPGFLYRTWIRSFLWFGLRFHVQESIGPEDVGPDHPGICQCGCRFPRKNNDVLTIDAWWTCCLKFIVLNVQNKEMSVFVTLTNGVEQLVHVLNILTLLCR